MYPDRGLSSDVHGQARLLQDDRSITTHKFDTYMQSYLNKLGKRYEEICKNKLFIYMKCIWLMIAHAIHDII